MCLVVSAWKATDGYRIIMSDDSLSAVVDDFYGFGHVSNVMDSWSRWRQVKEKDIIRRRKRVEPETAHDLALG